MNEAQLRGFQQLHREVMGSNPTYWLKSIGPLLTDEGKVPESLQYEVYIGPSKIGVVNSPIIGLWRWLHNSMVRGRDPVNTRCEAIANLIQFHLNWDEVSANTSKIVTKGFPIKIHEWRSGKVVEVIAESEAYEEDNGELYFDYSVPNVDPELYPGVAVYNKEKGFWEDGEF